MKKLKETLMTMLLATRYSFSFCWRNNKKDTIARLIVTILNTIVAYLIIQITGTVINTVQNLVKRKVVFISFNDFLQNSGIFWPIVFMLITVVIGMIIGRFSWYFRSSWNQALK